MIVVISTIVLRVFSGRKHTERVWNTVKPLNKGHIGENINSAVVLCREVVLFRAVAMSFKVVRPLQAIYLFFMAVRITCHPL